LGKHHLFLAAFFCRKQNKTPKRKKALLWFVSSLYA
jgi:hypothetical protein